MITFKQWQALNESYGGDFTLGLAKVPTVATLGAVLGDPVEELDESKKKMKKKMDVTAGEELAEKPELKKPVDDVKPEDDEDDIEDDDDDEDDDDTDVEDSDEGDEEEPMKGKEEPIMTPFMKKMKKMKKNLKKMKKEEQEWFNSVYSMLSGELNEKHWDGMGDRANKKSWDGFTRLEEDSLIPPADPNNGLVGEPGPGEVGFAPQARLGEE